MEGEGSGSLFTLPMRGHVREASEVAQSCECVFVFVRPRACADALLSCCAHNAVGCCCTRLEALRDLVTSPAPRQE